MSGLLYREDADEVRARLTTWWAGGDIGRPVMQITAPRDRPLEAVEPAPAPAGWLTNYSTASMEYRVHLTRAAGPGSVCLGEALPLVSPDLGPCCLALFLGCRGIETEGTVWAQPCIPSPAEAVFRADGENFYWDFCRRLLDEQLRWGRGECLIQFPDLIEGLDTLASMRGAEPLLVDLIERPAWVHDCLRRITEIYFHYYDFLYDRIRDECGGSVFWAWAPGRMAKFQCDFSAMISPEMFGEFMAPVLSEMCRRVTHCMYHWDGPGAIGHHGHLLAIPELDMLQWTPGGGAAPSWDRQWWPLFHKTFDAGKKVMIGCDGAQTLRKLKREFGESFKQFLFGMSARSVEEGQELLRVAAV